tara:strand:+ start:351 stop:683 length:333 start_codon:yes stop_codon:yes gene_type:complete
MNFIGIILFIIHTVIILGIPPFIIFSKNKKLLLLLFIGIIISYILNVYYKHCILTLLEKKINNMAIVDFFGQQFLPGFDGSNEDCNVAGATIIIYHGIFCFLKLLKLYYF